MGSAFTPVYPRGSSPMPMSVLNQSGGQSSRPNKRHRDHQNIPGLQHMVLDDIDEDEEETADETLPDHGSTSASEASSKASNNSQPPLLEFIGATCMASAWFTSCFPCAVVDINDSDDYVVDKLSRESAMNVMYAKSNNNGASSSTLSGVSHDDNNSPVFDERQSGGGSNEQDKNVIRVQLPEETVQNDAPIPSNPLVISEEDSQDEDVMDTISLNDEADCMPTMTPERMGSFILQHRESSFAEASIVASVASAEEDPIYSPKSPPKKKKKFGMKLFGRKKKA
mmetsp:Transcript_12058/g.21757  ORF Transcript_12058/g.21757 Transcript_12058/m.21757 type:complete len:283 (-) Transcript_12058:143-991(-)